MLYTFEGWFCSAKLLDFPFFAIALFCTVQVWKHRVSFCVSVTCKSLKQSHMKLQMWVVVCFCHSTYFKFFLFLLKFFPNFAAV